jgi:branched-chain amino acid transport system permease protein
VSGLARYRRAALLVLFGLAVAAVPLLITGQESRYVLKVLTFVGINAIIVTGLSLLHGYAGQVSLGHAAFYGLGAYTSGYLTAVVGVPWPVGVLAAVILTAAGGILLALPSLRLKGHYLAMATLGFGEIMRVVFVEATTITGGPDGLSGIPFASVGSFSFDTPQLNYWLVWGSVAVVLWISGNIVGGRPGRSMLALHGSPLGALASGVSITGLKVRVFTISAVFAGLAGALYSSVVGFVSPSTFTLHLSVILLAMAVLGGTRSLAGPLAAAVLMTLIPYADAVVPNMPREVLELLQDWQADVYGLVIILVVLFLPDGVAGLLRRTGMRRGETP